MSYWLSDAKTDTGESRVAAFNMKREGEKVRFGVLLINEHTRPGSYALSSEGKRVTIQITSEMATQSGTRCATHELWESTDETDPNH